MKSLLLVMLVAFFVACEDTPTPPTPTPTPAPGFKYNPIKLNVEEGAASDNPISAVAVRDQSGTQDDFSKYLEMSPAAGGRFVGSFDFTFPASLDDKSITSMTLLVNYRGPQATTQRWSFRLYDYQAGAYITIGDNTSAADWTWSLMSFNITNPNRFVGPGKIAKLEYNSVGAADNSQLDYVALNVVGRIDGTPTPTPTVTPSPTPTVGPTPTPSPTATPTPNPGAWYQPTPGTKWQIQFVGSIVTVNGAMVYDVDGIDTPDETITLFKSLGKKIICYFSAGSFEDWRDDAPLFPSSVKGKNMSGWAGEKWLDIRRIDILKPIMTARMDKLKARGCDAVDPDNVDGYTNDTGFSLKAADQLAYDKMLATEAHARGLGIGLKNNLLQINDLVDSFDFSINESCWDYDECDYMLPFVQKNKPVFGIEYTKTTAQFCPQSNSKNFDFVKKNHNLDAPVEYCR